MNGMDTSNQSTDTNSQEIEGNQLMDINRFKMNTSNQEQTMPIVASEKWDELIDTQKKQQVQEEDDDDNETTLRGKTILDVMRQVKNIYEGEDDSVNIKTENAVQFFDDLYGAVYPDLPLEEKQRIYKVLNDAYFDSFGEIAEEHFGGDDVIDPSEFEKMLTLMEEVTGIDFAEANGTKPNINRKALSITPIIENKIVQSYRVEYDNGETMIIDTAPSDKDEPPYNGK
jgi:hypothetical protein